MIEVQCPCGTKLRLGDEWGGKQGRCPRCQAVLDIPAANLPRPAGPPPAADAAPPAPAFAPPVSPAPAAKPAAAKPPPVPVARSTGTQAKRGSNRPTAPPVAGRATAAERADAAAEDQQLRDAAPAASNQLAGPPSGSGANPVRQWLTARPRLALALAGGTLVSLVLASLAIFLPAGRGGPPPGGDYVAADPLASAGVAAVPSSGGEERPPPAAAIRQDPAPSTAVAEPPAASVAAKVAAPAPTSQGPGAAAEVAPPRGSADSARPQPAKAAPSRELSGISRRYDDLECSRIQQRHARRVPAAATILEVDGQRLPVSNVGELQASPSPYLFLPRGAHLVRWREGERAIEVSIADDLAATYADMRSFFAVDGNVRSDELFSRGARAMDVHRTPFLLNFTAAVYAARNEWEAAERRFRRALRVNPLFAPAHLNLAYCLAQRKQSDQAVRELYLAQLFNIQDVFGLQPGIVQLGRELGVEPAELEQVPPVQLDAAAYLAPEPLSEEDRRLSAILLAASKYAAREEERGKILNNLAVHFAESRRPELALDHFRAALESFKLAGAARFELARRVLAQMAATCRRAGYVEAEEYAQMQNAVMP